MGNREVKVGHTEERSKELLECIDEILRHNSVGTKTLERLHGRIVWFRTFVFGRRLNAATRVLSWHSRRTGPSIRVDDQLRSALGTLRNHLVSSRQVSINRDINETWIIFTDGAFEPTKHTTSFNRWSPGEPKWASRFVLRCIPPAASP